MSRVKRLSKRRPRASQANRQSRHLDRAPLDFSRATYLTVREAMNYLRLPSVWAVYRWARRSAVPKCWAGGAIRFRRADIDRALAPPHEELHRVGR